MPSTDPPSEVRKIRQRTTEFLRTEDARGRRIGGARCGVYAFYDYDGEPIYVGQTRESMSTRIGRHLTGRRSDAVAKFVLDPFEVLEIEVWPMFDADGLPVPQRKAAVDAAEYAVFQQALADSQFGAVLNEGVIATHAPTALPPSFRGRIIPDDLYEDRAHGTRTCASRGARKRSRVWLG